MVKTPDWGDLGLDQDLGFHMVKTPDWRDLGLHQDLGFHIWLRNRTGGDLRPGNFVSRQRCVNFKLIQG
jgi:hypothetical protein